MIHDMSITLRHIGILLCTVYTAWGLYAPSCWASDAAPHPLQQLQRKNNLAACVATLNATKGGWCEIRPQHNASSITSVFPSDLDPRIHMVVGPKAVLGSFNSAAIDSEHKLIYFFGGGRSDYGGNEVYEFDLNRGQWARLTDPSALEFLFRRRRATANRPSEYCWIPDTRHQPASTQTFDGFEFHPHTRTLLLIVGAPAIGSCFKDTTAAFANDARVLSTPRGAPPWGVYEFNPSRQQVRNGLQPSSWRRVSDIRWPYPRLAILPNGTVIAGRRMQLWRVRFDNNQFSVGSVHSKTSDLGDGNAIYDQRRNLVWSLHERTLLGLAMDGTISHRLPTHSQLGRSLQLSNDGKLMSWSGWSEVSVLDPDISEPRWQTLEWDEHGPQHGGHRVYGKWRFLSDLNVFVGISSHRSGIWVYRHPVNAKMITWSTRNPQQLIARAKVGDTVRIPPGIYAHGLFINKSLTVQLKGVELRGVANNKGVINVRCDGCRIVIEDLKANGRKAGCIFYNCAGIKVEGAQFDVTVRRAQIENTVMGVLTDNRGGSLRIEDSLIEDTARFSNGRTLGHGVYAGKIDAVVVENSTIRRPFAKGHILKSRAVRTVVDHSKLLGLDAPHSRSIDMPCGGTLTVADSVINHGEHTDNFDVISVGTEPRSCGQWMRAGDVTIMRSTIAIDRDRSPDEPAHKAGPTGLFNWRTDLGALNVSHSKIIRRQGADLVWNHGATAIPDLRSSNRVITKR